jgi:tetratricopeptide (TPR) repeat protein
MKGEVDKGFEELKKAVKADPKQSSAITKMGDVYMARQDLKKAKDCFEQAVAITPDDRRAHQRLGLLYEQEGKRELAITHFEKGIEGTPADYVGVKVNLAGLYNEQMRFDKALALLEGRIDPTSTNTTALIVMGTAYLGVNKADEAIHVFERARTLAPDSEGPHLSLGIAYRQKGDLPASLKELEEVVKIKPQWSTGHFQKGETLLAMKAYDQALASYGQAEKLSPNPRLIRERKAEVYLAQQNIAEAIAIYKGLVGAKDVDLRAYDLLGSAYQMSGQFDLAEKTFADMRQRFAKQPFAYYRSGLFYGFVKKYGQAVAQLEKAHDMAPRDPMILKALSVAHNQQGSREKAIAAAETLLQIRPESLEDQFYLAGLYQDAGRRPNAARIYRALIEKKPDHALALNNLAVIVSTEGNLGEARRLAEKAAALAPENPMVLDTFGWILFQDKEPDKALAVLQKAAALLPGHAVIRYHLGAVQHAAGDRAAARENLAQALTISPDFDGAEEARKLLNK